MCNSNNEPVDFRHLMGMGYQHDWFDEQRSEQKQQRQEKEVCKFMHFQITSLFWVKQVKVRKGT